VKGTAYLLKASRTKVKSGGTITMNAGKVTFRCGAASVTATSSGVDLEAPKIEFTGDYVQSQGMSHE